MSVNTPRFQGICGERGAKAKLRDLEIKNIGVRGNLSVISLENDKDLANASHMVMVFATNVLNTGMVFESLPTEQSSDKDSTAKYATRLKNGTLPHLVETGTFSAVLKNKNAGKMKLYALATNGKRVSEIPLKQSNGKIEINVDTAKLPNGPALYFELAVK